MSERVQTVVNSRDDVTSLIKLKTEKNTKKESEVSFFNKMLVNKTLEEIQQSLKDEINSDSVADLLTLEETEDNGGIIALSGFYFQFMVSIDYLIELIEGKWDYLLIDHHQDVVVFNKEKIRFIQAKTKNKEYSDVTKTGLYKEWIQKLFELDKLFTHSTSYKTEFELVTNFTVRNSPNIPVEIYYSNENYDMNIKRNPFFNKIEEYSQKGNYEGLEGEYLEKLLSKFKMSKKDTTQYLDELEKKIGNLFNSRFKAVKEDIDFLIGYICSKCYYPSNPRIQFIDKQQALEIKEQIKNRFNKEARSYLEENDSLYYIDKYIIKLHQSFSSTIPLYSGLERYINEFELELKNHISDGGSLFNVISRYTERNFSSAKVNLSLGEEMTTSIKELLDITFFIKLINEGYLTIDDNHKILLLKKFGEEKFSFFNLLDTDDFSLAIKKIRDIIELLEFSDKINVFKEGPLKVIFSGEFDEDEFENGSFIEIKSSSSPSSNQLKENVKEEFKTALEGSIVEVPYEISVINGNNSKVRKFFRQRSKINEVEAYKMYIKKELNKE
ncbi:hypothetical protein [Priestia sp. TGN 0903]|uniref:hypothetical protein n=1 Tax=Priestia sp. TGN 0903 TaxID=3420730 RepID=UPI003D783756